MALRLKNTQQDRRAETFVATCREAGFSPSETTFLADQHAMFDRGSLRGNRLGPVMLMDFVDGAAARISDKLEQVNTPADLVDYRKNWIATWIGSQPDNDLTISSSVKLFAAIYKPSLTSQMEAWMDIGSALEGANTWEMAENHVNQKMIRVGLEGDAEIVPVPLKQAMKHLGLHTLTWSRWLYPTKYDEAQLGGALVAFNEGLQAQTGLEGPLLGLGGGVRLHMDDDTVGDQGGVFSNSTRIHSKTAGKNAFGSTQIRVPGHTSFAALGHEWFHAFDCMMGDVHNNTMSSNVPGTAAAQAVLALGSAFPTREGEADRMMPAILGLMRSAKVRLSKKPDELFSQFDQQVDSGEPDGGWGQWAIAMSASGEHQHYAVRSLGVIGSQATGSLRGNVAQAWLALYPNAYHEQAPEQMAYAFERACLHTGNLPSTTTDPTCVVRSCMPSEIAHTHQVLNQFFLSEEIRSKWDSMTKATEASPLLDAIAARRLTKRRAAAGAAASCPR